MVDKTELTERIAKERGALRRKLAQIRHWLGADPAASESLATLVDRVRGEIAALPDEQRRLFRTTASLAVADLRDSEDALKHYLDLVEGELKRRGAHAAAAKAYGSHPPPKAKRHPQRT